MSFYQFLFLNVYLIIVIIVAGDYSYLEETITKGQPVNFKNPALLQDPEQKLELKPLFIQKLNEMGSMAELAGFMAPSDHRFCTYATLKILEKVNNITKGKNNNTESQESMMKLKEQCAQIKRGRATTARGPDLKVREITKMNNARLEAKKVSCKPKSMQVELPPAPFGFSYYPHCVTVKRCGGCCNSALLECKPVNVINIKKWVMKFQVLARNKYERTQYFNMEQHESCKCSCKVLASHCSKAQIYDGDSCQCKCINESQSDSCGELKKWDPTQCSCVCKQSLPCSTGAQIHPNSCKCISSKTIRLRDRERSFE